MLANNRKSDSWRKNLKLISHCPVCGHDYKAEAAKIFANESEAKFVHFTCEYCHSHFMAMVMIMPKGMSTLGIVTDLSFADAKKLCKTQPLTIDEIIEGHKFINSRDFKLSF